MVVQVSMNAVRSIAVWRSRNRPKKHGHEETYQLAREWPFPALTSIPGSSVGAMCRARSVSEHARAEEGAVTRAQRAETGICLSSERGLPGDETILRFEGAPAPLVLPQLVRASVTVLQKLLDLGDRDLVAGTVL